MKRLFTFFFALCVCTFATHAAIIDGTCGNNLTWKLNTKDSTLVISGSGTMTSHPWHDYKSYIKYVTIQDGITSIVYKAFEGCTAIVEVKIGNSVTSIGEDAFSDCESLQSVNIPEGVTIIRSGTFGSCYSLTSISIPSSVTFVEDWAFWWTGIRAVYISDLTAWCNITFEDSEILGWNNADLYLNNELLEHVVIPEEIAEIKRFTFAGCSSIKSVTFGASVNSIAEESFSECHNLSQVTCYAANPPVAHNCGMNHTSSVLYVPEEYLSKYKNALWWEDFGTIRAIDPNLVGGNKDLKLIFKDRSMTSISTRTITVMFPPAPFIEGFNFLYWQPVAEPIDDVITIQAVYESKTSAAPKVSVNPTNPAQKLIRNGQVYILHEDKEYTISGQVIK